MGGPFCGVGLLLKKVAWHEGGILIQPPPSTDLASDLGMAAMLVRLLVGKGVDPSNQQQLVWQRETDLSFGVAAARPYGSKDHREGRVWSRTILILTIFRIYHCFCNDHRTTAAQIVMLLSNYYRYGIEE